MRCSAGREEQRRLVAICETHGCFLFSDEMYRDLEADPDTRLQAACDVYSKGVSLCGVSKSLSCPGLRIGWLVCRDKAFMDRVEGESKSGACASPALLCANLHMLARAPRKF